MTVAAQLWEMANNHAVVVPLTVDQYHHLIDMGKVPEGAPVELLNGCLVQKNRSSTGDDPMTVGHAHALIVGKLLELNGSLRRLGCHLRSQQPISLAPINEPEPDAAIVLGTLDDYRDRHPGPADVLCAIEVADSSLQHDRTTKLGIYAGAGIPLYIIINLVDRVMEVYSDPAAGLVPRYTTTRTLSPGQAISLPAAGGKAIKVAVRRLLP